MIKVLLIVDKFTPSTGGPYSILKETVHALSKKNINIKILSIYKKNKFYLENFIKKYDICHIYGGWTYSHVKAFYIASKLKKKIIIHPLGYYEPWSLAQKKIKKKIAWYVYQKKILHKADLIHCASNEEKKNLLNLSKNFKIKVIPYAISDNQIKHRLTNKKFNKKAIFFSRLHKKKGIENLINAWNEINDKYWSLDIFGPVNNKKYLKKLILLKKNNKVNFHEPVYKPSNKFSLLENYDLFILPTNSENFGMAILEALARGLPVLTTNKTPWSSIKKNRAGWIIKNNYDELKNILMKIFKLPQNVFYLKSSNAIKLAEKFSWKKISTIYIDTYKQLINEHI